MNTRCGDHIYFHGGAGPLSGRVVATGHHGATVEVEGKHHKVLWKHVLGHRVRTRPRFNVVDSGEDGSIVEDERGNRKYLAVKHMGGSTVSAQGPSGAPHNSEPLMKSLPQDARFVLMLKGSPHAAQSLPVSSLGMNPRCAPGTQVLCVHHGKHVVADVVSVPSSDSHEYVVRIAKGFRKGYLMTVPTSGIRGTHTMESHGSGPTLGKSLIMIKGDSVKNRPGLALTDITDRSGRHTKRWKRTSKESAQTRVSGAPEERSAKDTKNTGVGSSYGTHNMEVGDSVKFQTPSARGSGKIVGVGKDGSRVQDKAGNEHNVLWKFITGFRGPKTVGTHDSEKWDVPSRNTLKQVDPDNFSAHEFYKYHNDPSVTVDDVLLRFPSDTGSKIIDAINRLKTIEPTYKRFKENGHYTQERQRKHAEIISSFLSEEKIKAAIPETGKPPTLYILGGRGGSGKSQFEDLVYNPRRCIVIDPDSIKKKFFGYEGWNAGEFHEESSEIAGEITRLAREGGANVVIDKTLASLSIMKQIQAFKDSGYRTEAHYMFLPRRKAAYRAVKRFLGKTKRLVPISIILEDNTKNERNFDVVRKVVDKWSFMSNDVAKDTPAVLISESGNEGDRHEK